MKTYVACPGKPLWLGRQGENGARQILFDVSAWQQIYGPGIVQLLAKRTGDTTPYPISVTTEGGLARWTISAADVGVAGNYGAAELIYSVGGQVAKSDVWQTVVSPALDNASPTPPEPAQGWVDAVLQAGAAAQEAADRAEEAASHAPYIGDDGMWYVWDPETGSYINTGTPASGSGGGYKIGSGLKLDSATNTLSVDVATDAEADNTRPITSAAVYTEIGNIDILLQTI